MPNPPELVRLSDFLSLWQVYDSSVKSDLFSTAAETDGRLYFIDPTPLHPDSLAEVTSDRSVAGILVTNSNHPRDAGRFAEKFQVPLFAACAMPELGEITIVSIKAGEIAPGLSAIPLPGAATGELAFHFADDGGTVVLGDALINFEPDGFALLPVKYCTNQKVMKRSLRQLLDWRFERLLFAHGLPILSSARERLETLLR